MHSLYTDEHCYTYERIFSVFPTRLSLVEWHCELHFTSFIMHMGKRVCVWWQMFAVQSSLWDSHMYPIWRVYIRVAEQVTRPSSHMQSIQSMCVVSSESESHPIYMRSRVNGAFWSARSRVMMCLYSVPCLWHTNHITRWRTASERASPHIAHHMSLRKASPQIKRRSKKISENILGDGNSI